MKMIKLGLTAAALSMAVGLAAPAFAQGTDENDQMMMKKVPAKHTHGSAARAQPNYGTYKPLTVARPAVAPTAGPLGIITAPIGFAGQLATAPLNGLSQAFGYGPIGGPSKPLPIVAKYAGVGPVTDSVNQGWAQPVPVSANGPIYKLEPVKNSGGLSPFAVIAAPITAATTLATAPVYAVGGVLGGGPAPAPVF